MIEVKNLVKRYGDHTAVDHLSFEIEKGKIYGFLGPNGAGKSTTMHMITGYIASTEGTVVINGHDSLEEPEEAKKDIGYLPEQPPLYMDMTVKEYLNFIAAIKGIDTVTAKKQITELLKIVNLSDVAEKKIRTFSGGMKQRLGIAQAVINDPHILVLDEPTAGLDPKERMRFRNLIAELAKDKIVILSTHIVSDIDYIADDILMMKKGSLILNCSTEKAIHSMDGKVWNCKLLQSQINEVSERFRVVNLHHEQGNEVLLRVVSDTQPMCGAVNVPPTLDDLYLYHFQDEEIRRDEE